jgi:hypothetical protein
MHRLAKAEIGRRHEDRGEQEFDRRTAGEDHRQRLQRAASQGGDEPRERRLAAKPDQDGEAKHGERGKDRDGHQVQTNHRPHLTPPVPLRPEHY